VATKSKTPVSTASTKSASTAEINRKRKLLKQLKLQPNNEQVKDALVNIKYRRKTPKSQEWSKSDIQVAKLFKEFTGRADWDLFSSNPKVQAAAIAMHSKKSFDNLPEGKVSFLLGARAHDKYGNLVWV
jgi:hypothetical protein